VTRGEDVNGSEHGFGPPDEHLRETLKRERGEVPAESPSEPAEKALEEHERDEREGGKEEGGR
jgi:hypothetical protein